MEENNHIKVKGLAEFNLRACRFFQNTLTRCLEINLVTRIQVKVVLQID